jgi:O-antigen/teichoic acid export membrane protein
MKRLSLSAIFLLLPYSLQQQISKINNNEITGRIFRGSFWALSGSVLSKGLLLISSIVIARILGKLQYGELGIIQSTINMFAAFASFGLGMTATKYIAELRDNNPEKAGSIIATSNLFAGIIGFIFTAVFLLFTPVIADNLISAPGLVNEMRLGSVMLFFIALNGAQTGAMAGFENFKGIAIINIIVGLFSFPIQIILTLFFGLNGTIIGLGITYLLQWVLNFFILRSTARKFNIKIRTHKALKDISFLWEFSIPAVFGSVIVSITLWYANTILVSKINGFSEMAIFNAASQWQNIVLFIPMAVSQISLPLFSYSKNNKIQFVKLIRYNLILNLVVSLILAVLFSIFSKIIMQTYGDSFKEGYPVIIVLTFTAVLISINSVIGQVIAGIGRMWIGFLVNLIWALIFIALAKHFINNGMGAIGLAKSMLFAYLVHTLNTALVSYYYIRRRT